MGKYFGLFFVSLATLMLEILLTRIFSVVTWYYFAFFAVSVAMFGLTIGALAVYIFKDYFSQEKLYQRLSLFALLSGISACLSLMIFLSIPFHPRLSGIGIFSTIFIYLVITAPFACSGVVICLCLTRFPKKIGLLYAVDLIGAAMGAFMVFPVLNSMDAPTAVFFVGSIASLGGVCFAGLSKNNRMVSQRLFKSATVTLLILISLTHANLFFRLFRIEWVKMQYSRPIVESWNTFSRIAVYPFKWTLKPYSWGLSTVYKPAKPVGEIMMDIDGVSNTVMTRYDGTAESIEHLKYDVTSVAHYLRSDAKVFIIGVGGGRDILAALAFNQSEVVGAEINGKILEMANKTFADFTGHLDKLPGVKIINDEARSALTRMDDRFDIIQASCIATWSATSAGALTLAENSLYTVEAWKIFFEHLTPGGILSFNRWYSTDYPAQLLRLFSLAVEMLNNQGIKQPGEHIAVVRSDMQGYVEAATILVSKTPFSYEDIERLRSVVARLKFKLEYDPSGYQNPLFRSIIDNLGNKEFYQSTQLDVSAPTDDRPFFFYMLRLKDMFKGRHLQYKEQRFNLEGMRMLYILLGVSVLLCVLFIFYPLRFLKLNTPLINKGWVACVFFASIGFGYILVEIAQLQRLIIFLGHPIYSITVVLFSMLFASGLGAMTSNRWISSGRVKAVNIIFPMAAVLSLLILVTYKQPEILLAFEKQGINFRIMVSLLFLIPLGFFMGFPFPLGMSLAAVKFREHTPWFWAINGATSVVSSVLSVCISIIWGFTATLGAGFFCYIVAAIFILLLYKNNPQ